MREEIANLIYPVFTHGLHLKERLAARENVDLATSHRELQGLLQSSSSAQRYEDYGGDIPANSNISLRPESTRSRGSVFLGIRYALVCWLDEIFILDSPWGEQWRERCLEGALGYGVERAWRFWEQAEMASARPNTDALEVFYLCVMLGFRGNKSTEEVKNWCDKAKAQMARGQTDIYKLPVEGPFETRVGPLTGADRAQSMRTPVFVLAGILCFMIVFWVIKKLVG